MVVPLGAIALALVTYSETLTIRLDVSPLTRMLGRLGSTAAMRWLNRNEHDINQVLIYGLPLLACLVVRRRPVVLGLTLAGVLLTANLVDGRRQDVVRQARGFFGVLRVTRDRDDPGYTELRHGTTIHGRQSRDPARRGEPLSYYHRKGPVGYVFAELDRRDTSRRVAVVGLGTGTLAAYARPGEAMTIYEIDRLVRDIAFDPRYFTYVKDARDRGASIRVELATRACASRSCGGSGRGALRPDHGRPFTSDAIPVHLLTREALRLYVDMLTPRGLLAVPSPTVPAARAVWPPSPTTPSSAAGSCWKTPDGNGAASLDVGRAGSKPEALGQPPATRRFATPLEADPRSALDRRLPHLLAVFKCKAHHQLGPVAGGHPAVGGPHRARAIGQAPAEDLAGGVSSRRPP